MSKRTSPNTEPSGALILDFSASRTVKSNFCFLETTQVVVFLLQHSEQTETTYEHRSNQTPSAAHLDGLRVQDIDTDGGRKATGPGFYIHERALLQNFHIIFKQCLLWAELSPTPRLNSCIEVLTPLECDCLWMIESRSN